MSELQLNITTGLAGAALVLHSLAPAGRWLAGAYRVVVAAGGLKGLVLNFWRGKAAPVSENQPTNKT